MKWNHISERQPDHGEIIVQIDTPFMGHYTMGMRTYYQTVTYKQLLEYCKENNIHDPDFWWMSAKDFPWPNKEEVRE